MRGGWIFSRSGLSSSEAEAAGQPEVLSDTGSAGDSAFRWPGDVAGWLV